MNTNQNHKSRWTTILHSFLLSLGLFTVSSFISEVRPSDFVVDTKFTIKDTNDLNTNWVKQVSRPIQSAQFEHPRQTDTQYFEIENWFETHVIFFAIYPDNNFYKTFPWYHIHRHGPAHRLSGWKDGNFLFKALSLDKS